MCTQTFEIERVEVTALDHKQVKCYDITIKMEGENETIPHDIRQLVQQKMQEIGKILHSYAIIEEKASFAGAVEGAVNKELESTGVSCRDIHIKRTGY